MILASLARYYRRLAAEEDVVGNPKVPPYGFSEEKIGWILVLNSDGILQDVVPNLTTDKKPQPKLIRVPKAGGASSNSIKPKFLWGNTQYVLGITRKETKNKNRTKECFDKFKALHMDLLKDSQDDGIKSLYRFLEVWQPEDFGNLSSLFKPEIIDSNLVFSLDKPSAFIHKRGVAQDIWLKYLQEDSERKDFCLISGEKAKIARTHPVIKGIYGGEKSGGMIISFNKESFTSFGKKQGANAPVSEASAFAYTTALNYLLRRENNHCFTIGDCSTVFWAEAAGNNAVVATAAEDLFANMMNPPDDEQESQKIFNILEQIAKGRPLQKIAPDLSPDTRFYILGLAPNTTRISIRFWHESTFGQLAKNMAKHWQDLYIEPPAWSSKAPSIWRILLETTPKRKGADGRLKKSETKDIPPQLAGEFMRSVLTGRAYPQTMLSRMIGRIRSDGYITGLRVAVIKAVLNRNSFQTQEIAMELDNQKENAKLPVGLNKDETDIPYRLGRLFAVLEVAQASALGKLNATVRDKFYGSASTSPQYVFPRLLENYNNHIAVLRKGRGADWIKKPKSTANWLEQEVGQILQIFRSVKPFPRQLSLEEQGRFVVGYYHQKYTKQHEAPEDIGSVLDNDNNVEKN